MFAEFSELVLSFQEIGMLEPQFDTKEEDGKVGHRRAGCVAGTWLHEHVGKTWLGNPKDLMIYHPNSPFEISIQM